MRRFILFLFFAIVIFLVVSALTPFPENYLSKLMPDNKLYFLKIWHEKSVIFFTFDVAKRADKYREFAEERAYEAQEMVGQGKIELAEKLNEVYKNYLNKAEEAMKRAIEKAIRQGEEELQKELEEKVDDIMNKIKEGIKL